MRTRTRRRGICRILVGKNNVKWLKEAGILPGLLVSPALFEVYWVVSGSLRHVRQVALCLLAPSGDQVF